VTASRTRLLKFPGSWSSSFVPYETSCNVTQPEMQHASQPCNEMGRVQLLPPCPYTMPTESHA
jgi:hypothetical protein